MWLSHPTVLRVAETSPRARRCGLGWGKTGGLRHWAMPGRPTSRVGSFGEVHWAGGSPPDGRWGCWPPPSLVLWTALRAMVTWRARLVLGQPRGPALG